MQRLGQQVDGWTHCWVEERMDATKLGKLEQAQQEGAEIAQWVKAFAAKTKPQVQSLPPQGGRGQPMPGSCFLTSTSKLWHTPLNN